MKKEGNKENKENKKTENGEDIKDIVDNNLNKRIILKKKIKMINL